MTIANTFASKLTVGFVAVAMIFSLSFATTANAQTVEELQAQITALLAQITALQGQLGGGAPAAAAGCTFTRSLTIGASGADVTCLQNYLMSTGQSIPAGATGYFGSQTQAAVAGWQAANGVAPAAGYFGPISQAKYTMLMAAAPAPSDDDANDDAANDDDVTLSGEASLDQFNTDDGDDTSLEEGQEDAPVAEFEVEFADGDGKITRLDVELVGSGDETDPWDTFENVSLWVDGEKVAEVNADDEDDYLDEDDGSLRFSGLSIVGMEDEPVVLDVRVSVQSSVDGTSDGEDWTIAATGMRFLDATDVTTTETTFDEMTDTVDFDIDEEGNDDEITVKTSADDPDSTTLPVQDDEKSDWLTIFAFDLDTDDSINDIEINDLQVDVDGLESDGTTATSTTNLIADARLMVDGEEVGDVDITHGTTGEFVFDFDNGEWVIDAGDRVTAEFQVEFKALSSALEGATVEASADSADVTAEGADDLAGSQLSGAATGDQHTLRTEGAILEINSTSETIKENDANDVTDDQGQFVVKFDVTAFETDIFVNKSAASGTTMASQGVNFLVEDSAGDQVTLGTSSGSLSSTADTEGSQFKVSEGETETFTLTVVYDPSTQGFYQVQLYSFNFKNASGGSPNTQQLALPASDYETDQISI
jgi:hypothetical protein